MQTAQAVWNSFDTISDAYIAANGREDEKRLQEQISDVFEKIEDGEYILQTGENASVADDLAQADFFASEQEVPYSEILRFHVRANSDLAEDQELKMAVKEDVLALLNPILSHCSNVDESREQIRLNLQNIYTVATHTIAEQGFDYDVKVYLTKEEFPAKTYGDLTFPPGEYEALRIDIGRAEGKNWWCVMYPPLCLMDGYMVVVSEEGKEELRQVLTEKEYADLFVKKESAPEIKVKSYFLNRLFREE